MEKTTNEKKNKICTTISNIILILLVIIVIKLSYQIITVPNKTPHIFGNKLYVIISGSMDPKLKIGDLVVVNKNKTPKQNDIIAYREDSIVVVHRAVEITKTQDGNIEYKTRGDRNNSNDLRPVVPSQVEGVVIFKIWFIGYILIYLVRYFPIIISTTAILIIIIKLIKKQLK